MVRGGLKLYLVPVPNKTKTPPLRFSTLRYIVSDRVVGSWWVAWSSPLLSPMQTALRRVLAPLHRGVCGSPLSAAAELAPPARTLPPHWKGDNLFDILVKLPNYGVGALVYRTSWVEKGWEPEKFHWRITQTKDFKIVRLLSLRPPSHALSRSCALTLATRKASKTTTFNVGRRTAS